MKVAAWGEEEGRGEGHWHTVLAMSWRGRSCNGCVEEGGGRVL